MTASMMHLAPNLLVLFMLVLAIGPLVIAWQDARRRAQAGVRLVALKREARVAAGLRARQPDRRAALEWNGATRG